MISIQKIRERYAGLEKERIVKIAKYDAKGLRPEVVPILIEEINKRGLSKGLINWILAERRVLTDAELNDLKRKTKATTCTLCKKRQELKGYAFQTITGLVIHETVTNEELIVCEKCGTKKRRASTLWTLFFGWWSFGGLISTPFILAEKLKARFLEKKQSEAIIESFIQTYIGTITLSEDDPKVIQNLLKKQNRRNDD